MIIRPQDIPFEKIIIPEFWDKGHRTTYTINNNLIIPVKINTIDIENSVENNILR